MRARYVPWLWIWACGGAPPEVAPDAEEGEVTAAAGLLEPAAWLTRASLDIRGKRPSLDELEAIKRSPEALPELVDAFLDSPDFAGRVTALYAELFQTRHEDPFVFIDYYEPFWTSEQLSRSIGEEPLRVLGHIAGQDLSYREMVTGDWTMANQVLADIWPVTYAPGGDTWQLSRYTDDRPSAGVLASNGMWWQFGSMENNLNRGRANQVSRIFLCADYLDLEIDFGTNQPLDSEAALGDAIRTDPNCTACHETLDPLSSHFFGFWYFSARKNAPYDASVYHAEREREWSAYDMPAPAFRERRTSGLADFGRQLADDPRFGRCFVQHTWNALLRRAPGPDDAAALAARVEDFEAADLRLRDLFRSFALSDVYAEGSGPHGRKLVEPALLSGMVFDLTGYRLTVDAWDLVRAPLSGYSSLLGGVDGIHRFEPMSEPGATFLLVNKRLAEAAASYVVRSDLDDPSRARLLTGVDGTEDPVVDREQILSQLVSLRARILSQRRTTDDPEVLEDMVLWESLYEASGTHFTAWTGVVSLLLRDPDFVTY